MKDRYERTIDYLRVSVTDRCNLRCRYCMPGEGVTSLGHDAILSYEELLRICAIAVRQGVKKIRVTGGEPLVRLGIVDFIRKLATLPEKPEISLTTNGLLLEEQAADLKAAGLSRVNVSLDSLLPHRFAHITRRSGLERVLRGIAAAEKAGLTPLKINMVPIEGWNADEIAEFGRLSLQRGWEVRFIELMPVGAEAGFPNHRRYPLESIRQDLELLGPLTPVERQGSAGPARLFQIGDGPGRVGIIPAVSEHFCAECNRLRITADGMVQPCLFSRDQIDLKGALRSGATDAELEALLLESVGAKPKRHRIGQAGFDFGSRPMSGIGG